MVMMVQKEVAQRMAAKPGKTGLLSLAVQVYSRSELILSVPAAAFYPIPNVDSAVVFCDLTKPNAAYVNLSAAEQKRFWQLARAGFSSRRKMLKKNLGALREFAAIDFIDLFSRQNIAPQARAQELSVDQWAALAKALS